MMFLTTPHESCQSLMVDTQSRWHILLCEPNREKAAMRRLEQLGYEPYAPMIPHMTMRSFRCMFGMLRRSYKGERPLFPGYLFLELSEASALQSIYTVDGLRRTPFLIIDGTRAVLRDGMIDDIRHIEMTQKNPAVPGLPYMVGDRVRVLDGPFADRIGEISRLDDAERIELLMDMLGGKTRVFASAKQIAID